MSKPEFLRKTVRVLVACLASATLGGALPAAAGAWEVQEVYQDASTMLITSLVLDNQSRPHIAFVKTMSTSSPTYPYYTSHDVLKYAAYDGLGWTVETVSENGSGLFCPPIVTDSANQPTIFYGPMSYRRAYPWEASPGGWVGYPFTSHSVRYVSAATDPGFWPGYPYWPSMSLHLSYVTEAGLFYNTSTSPATETLVDPQAAAPGSDAIGQVSSVIVLGGVPHIAYMRPTEPYDPAIPYWSPGYIQPRWEICHAWLTPAGWQTEVIDTIDGYAEPGLRADAAGGLHCCYGKYAYRGGEGQGWTVLPGSVSTIPAFNPLRSGVLDMMVGNYLWHLDLNPPVTPPYSNSWGEEIFPQLANEWTLSSNDAMAVSRYSYGQPYRAAVSTTGWDDSTPPGTYQSRVRYVSQAPWIELDLSSEGAEGAAFVVSPFKEKAFPSPSAIRWERGAWMELQAVAPEGALFLHWKDADTGEIVSTNGYNYRFALLTPRRLAAVYLPSNQPPRITSSPVTAADDASTYLYDVEAVDPDAQDVLTFSLEVMPEGMTIDPATGVITWSPLRAQVGDHPVTVKVTDSKGAFDTQPFTVTVAHINRPPVIAVPTPAPVPPGQRVTITPIASDPDGDALTFSISGLPWSAAFDPAGGSFSWLPTCSDEGDHELVFTVSDGAAGASATVNAHVIVDADGDGVAGCGDLCPRENASGFDADRNGCLDTVAGLESVIDSLPADALSPQAESGLMAKAQSALASVAAGRSSTAVNQLGAFINHVEAQRGKKISPAAADSLIAYARSVIARLEAAP
jgi:hypothetical protein